MSKLLISFIFIINFNLLFAIDTNESDIKFKLASEAVKNREYTRAIEIFEELSFDAEHDAQYNLALLKKTGKGYPQDYKDSLKWAWLALLGDIPQANDLVGELKKTLPDNTQNQVREQVLKFLKSRAESGNYNAIKQMGEYYLTVPKEPDYKLSYLWFLIASAFQIEGSIDKRDNVEKQIEPKDIVAVQLNAKKIFGVIKHGKNVNDNNQVNKLEEIKNED